MYNIYASENRAVKVTAAMTAGQDSPAVSQLFLFSFRMMQERCRAPLSTVDITPETAFPVLGPGRQHTSYAIYSY